MVHSCSAAYYPLYDELARGLWTQSLIANFRLCLPTADTTLMRGPPYGRFRL